MDITNCDDYPTHLDLTHNYWGTADPDSIQNLIYDYHDSTAACNIIDYIPFLDTTTPTEKKSMGGIKALFR